MNNSKIEIQMGRVEQGNNISTSHTYFFIAQIRVVLNVQHLMLKLLMHIYANY